MYEIYFPQQLGFDVFAPQLSVQNLFPKILHVIDPELLHKHLFPKLADGSMETERNYVIPLHCLVCEED